MKLTPRGCKNIGGDVALSVEELRRDFMEAFVPYGYRPFWPSGLQLLESITDKISPNLHNRFLVTNSFFGEPCAVRTDVTLGVVDYCASHFEPHERPLRLCYTERIYRRPKSPDKNVEKLQMGAELIGWEGEGADVELISLLLSFLNGLNCPKIALTLGDVSLIQRAIKSLPSPHGKVLLDCLERGSLDEYAEAAKNLPPSPLSTFFEELPWLKGNAEVLYRASELLDEMEEAIRPLKLIYSELAKLGHENSIVVDLSLVRELDYYSGPIFDVYFEETGVSVGGGGRYDRLLEACGMLGQAVGFALDLERLALSVNKKRGKAQKILLWAQKNAPSYVLKCAEELILLGYSVEILWREKDPDIRELARIKGYDLLLDLNRGNIIELSSGDETFLDDFLGGENDD